MSNLGGNNVIYQKSTYIIFHCGDGYIAHNTQKHFKSGHTHLKSFKSCVDAIHFSINKVIPTDSSLYYLVSLRRLSTDPSFIVSLDNMIKIKTLERASTPNKRKNKKRG